jgi:hypothetical protein
MSTRCRKFVAISVLAAALLPFPVRAGQTAKSTVSPEKLQEQLEQQQQRIAELERLLAQQGQLLEAIRQQVTTTPQKNPAAASAGADVPAAQEVERISGELDALAEHDHALTQKVNTLEKATEEAQKKLASAASPLSFSGDVRMRYEPFFQGGGFITRHRERARARLNLTGKLTDELSGGISFASGSLDDVNSSNQTLTGFFTRKTIGLDRYFVQYKPNWGKPLSLVAGKFTYPWYRTPLTFDNDINPEGFAQTFRFDIKNPVLKNITFVGFELPFNESSGAYDSFIFGGQVQTSWRLSDKASLRLYGAGIDFNRADPIAVAIAAGELRPSLPNTNRFRTNSAGQVIGYASKFFYLDLIGALDYKLHPRWPVLAQFNFVNNTRASRERSGYWAEIQFGRLNEPKDTQVGYTFARVERDAVIGAFNESDLRASTNVRNHRVNFGYQTHRNVSVIYTLWVGRLADPRDNLSLVPVASRATCASAPITGCIDPFLKRMQLDLVYKF